MNKTQSYIAPIIVAVTQMLSQPVAAQTHELQFDTANQIALVLQDLDMESRYTRSIPAHQLAIREFRTRFIELVEFDKDPI